MFVNYIAKIKYNFKSNLILQVMMTITAIKTTPPTATPQIRPTKILMITAIKTTPPTATPQIRPTKNTNVELRVPDNE